MPMPTRSWPARRILAMAGMPLIALGLGAGLPAAQSTEKHAVPGASVAIWDLAGQVTVEPGTGSDVVVEVTRGGPDGSRLRVEQGPIGEWQTLRVVFPADHVVYREPSAWGTHLEVGEDGRFDDRTLFPGKTPRRRVLISGRGSGLDAHADLRVRVPAGRTLQLFLGVGAATISNVDGDLRVRAASASVTTRGTRGPLAIDSGSGELRVRDARGDVVLDTGSGGALVRGVRGERLRLDTGSGGVTVLDAEVKELRVDTGSGSVEIADLRAPDITLDSGSGAVRMNLLRGPLRSLTIDTGSGGVTLGVPLEIDASFEIETGSGGIHIGVPHEVVERAHDSVRGRFGGGHGHIRIDTGSGGVRIIPRAASGAQLHSVPGALISLTFA